MLYLFPMQYLIQFNGNPVTLVLKNNQMKIKLTYLNIKKEIKLN